MTLNEYQQQAMTTCMPSSENFSYMMLNLVGEVGEFIDYAIPHTDGITCDYLDALRLDMLNCGKVAKNIRKNPEEFDPVELNIEGLTDHEKKGLQKEAGDIIWQVAGLCHVMGWNLEDIARQNLEKLASRKERNVIDGNGDNR